MADDAGDMTLLQVILFMIKWLFAVVFEIASLIPSWIWITIAVVIYVRYLCLPSGTSQESGMRVKLTSVLLLNQCASCREWYKHFAASMSVCFAIT